MAIQDNDSFLFEVRCPFERKSKKDEKMYPCNRLCVEVRAGSSGRARCRSCGLRFEFEVDSQSMISRGVRVKKEETIRNTTSNVASDE